MNDKGDVQVFPLVTLRDYFAAKAMQSDLSSRNNGLYKGSHSSVFAIDDAKKYYEMADAMMAVREENPTIAKAMGEA